MGRTELASRAEDGAKALPDHLEVLPGSFSESFCGRSLRGKPTSPIGFERRFNKVFRIVDEGEFVERIVADMPPPPQATANRARNAGLEPTS
jgi:hydroxyacylglutathione hydrolase